MQGNATSQDVVADQQREIIRYLGGLNTWLERDVIDRQFELRALHERMDQLRDELLHRLGRPPTPLMHRREYRPNLIDAHCLLAQRLAPYGPQIVGQVPPGGVVIPPIPDRGPSRLSHRSQVIVPPALSDSVGPIVYPIPSSTEETSTTSESDDRSFQIPGIPPTRGATPVSRPVVPSHISTTDESTFSSTTSTGEEDFEVHVIPPAIHPQAPPPIEFEPSRPPSSVTQDGSIVIPPPASSSGAPAAPSVASPPPAAPSVASPPPAAPSVTSPPPAVPSVVSPAPTVIIVQPPPVEPVSVPVPVPMPVLAPIPAPESESESPESALTEVRG
jgi:hypothetical protein